MGNKSLNRIHAILHRLTDEELAIFGSYLTGFQKQYGNYESKYYKLYKCLLDIPKIVDEEEIQQKVSPGSSSETFHKLCSRFREKLYDSLLTDFNIKRSPNPYSRPARIGFKIRKELTLAQILYTRGLTEDARVLLENGYKESCTYNHFSEAVSFLNILYTLYSRLGHHKKTAEIEEQLEVTRGLRNITEISENYFNSLLVREYYRGNLEAYQEEIKSKLHILERDTYLKQSKLANYYYLYISTHYNRIRKEYGLMEFYARETLHLLIQNPPLQSNPRIVNSYLLLVDANVYNRNFKQAIEHTEQALKELIKGNRNYPDIQLQKSVICIYDGQYDNANKIIQELIKLAEDGKRGNLVPANKLLYYSATLAFLSKKYTEAHKIASQISSFSQDKEGWNINARILRVMIMIENKYLDEADQEIENFRRSLQNIMKTHPVSKRNILIFRMLTWLSKKDFDFARVYKDHHKLWLMLASDDPELRWDFLTPEIIPFHTWFENHAMKRRVDENFYIMPEEKPGASMNVVEQKVD